MFSARRAFYWTLTATLLLQSAWILAMPAFRGIDEFDHVYKTKSVAHGHFMDEGAAPNGGHGRLIVTTRSVVNAATDTCATYYYTSRANCHPVERREGGFVTVASGAAKYNPAYYAVVGVLTLPFDGVAANFAMRGFTALLAALLLAWAVVVTVSWARSSWPLLALVVAASPVLVYSTAFASPNGIGYAAGILLWASGLGLASVPRRSHWVALASAGLIMMVTHTTGLMWLGLSLCLITLLRPLVAWRDVWHRFRPVAMPTFGALALGCVGTLGWILSAKTNLDGTSDGVGNISDLTPAVLANSQLLWGLQTIAAFPLRDEPAAAPIYPMWLLPLVVLMALGLRRADRRLRRILLLLGALWIAIPWVLTLLSYPSVGLAWQGRYALPLAVGAPAIAGFVLDRLGRAPQPFFVVMSMSLCAGAHAISCISVSLEEGDRGLPGTFVAEYPGGVSAIAALAIAAGLTITIPFARRAKSGSSIETQPAESRAGAAL